MKSVFLLTFICLSFFGVIYSQDTCVGSVGDVEYDLTSLMYDPTAAPPDGYSIDANENTYYVNFCASISTTIGSNACNKAENSGACQMSAGNTIVLVLFLVMHS